MTRSSQRSIAALGLCVILNACSFDYEIALPNGYKLVRANQYEIVITNDKQLVVIDGKIERFQEVDAMVVGYVAVPNWPDSKPSQVTGIKAGYFILDTKDGALEKGLSEKEWQQRLAVRGVKSVRLNEVKHPLIPWVS